MGKIGGVVATFLILAAVGAGVYWIYKEITLPLPGNAVEDLGRDHVADITSVTYNSDPPTSGAHFPIWAKRGVYDQVISDGYLIHSLEHGYIIMSYNCDSLKAGYLPELVDASLSAEVDPQMSAFSPESAPVGIDVPESFNSEECRQLVGKLSKFLEEFERVIVVPRPQMDTHIALTAWNFLDKMESFNEDRIRDFVKTYHNKGPEQTIE